MRLSRGAGAVSAFPGLTLKLETFREPILGFGFVPLNLMRPL
jgi:hypothetical protein